jgi:hypothetical protein
MAFSLEREAQNAYTHGFEAIYALEQVDVSTIRPMGPKKAKEESVPKKGKAPVPLQLELPLGERFLSAVVPYSYAPWIEAFSRAVEPLPLYCLLQCYSLSHLVTLPPRERVDFVRSSEEKKALLAQEGKQAVRKAFPIASMLYPFVERYFIPWIRGREGLATTDELMERIYQISDDEGVAHKLFSLFSDLFFEGAFPLSAHLIPLDRNLWGSDPFVLNHYQSCMKIARTYFYKKNSRYKMGELIFWIQREALNEGEVFEEKFIERSLRLSPQIQFLTCRPDSCRTLCFRELDHNSSMSAPKGLSAESQVQ